MEEHRAPQTHVAVGGCGRPVDEGYCEVGVMIGGGKRAVERARDFYSNSVNAGNGCRRDVYIKISECADWRRQKLRVDPNGCPVVDALENKTRHRFHRVDVKRCAVPKTMSGRMYGATVGG